MKEAEYIQQVVEGHAGNMKHGQARITNLDSFQSVMPDHVVLVTCKREVLVLIPPS